MNDELRSNASARLKAIRAGAPERFPGETTMAEMAIRDADQANVLAHGGALTRCFAEIKAEPVRWLWPGRIPRGKLSLLIGDPGLGKSLVTVDIAARVSRGLSFTDGAACEPGGTIFLSAEDDAADTIRPRLDAASADVSRIHALESVRVPLADGTTGEKQFSLETDIAHLESALARIHNPLLVVIDPISAYLGGRADSHANADVRALLAPVAAMAMRSSVAVLAVTHLRKSPGAAVHRAIGSIAFAAAARAVWIVVPDPEDESRRLMLAVKQNLAAPTAGLAFRVEATGGTARIEWEPGGVTISADDVLGENITRDSGGALAEAREWLTDALAGGPVAAKKIQWEAQATGIAAITLRRAKKSLRVEKRKCAFSGGWEWYLPESAHAEDAQHVASQMSTFEQPVEKQKVTNGASREGAQVSDVSTFGDDDEVRL